MNDRDLNRIERVSAILMNTTISSWARKYWTKVLSQLLLNSSTGSEDVISRSAGLPHLWSTTGHPLKQRLIGETNYDRDHVTNT